MKKNKAFKDNLLDLLNSDNDIKVFFDQMITTKVEDVFIDFLIKDDYHEEQVAVSDNNLESIIHNKIQNYFYHTYMRINHLRYEKFLIEIEEVQSLQNKEISSEFDFYQSIMQESEEQILFYDNLIPKCKISDEDLFIIFEYLVKNKMIFGDYIDFASFCEKSWNTKSLNWIDKKGYNSKSKVVTYVLLFDLLHNVIFQESKHFEGFKRQMFLKNICESFLFDGEKKNFNLLNTGYSSWENEYRLTKPFL